ncbi:MAG: hypothetical protein AAGG01_01195 [Planctomycetota bacterium]
MLLPLLTTLLLGATAPGAPQVPDKEAPVPAAIRTADVPASLELTATHFLAKSRVQESQWLVFKNSEIGWLRIRGLRPFETALLPVPAGGAKGVSIELVGRLENGAYASTGTFSCETLQGETVFVERTATALVGWIPRHGGKSLTRLATQPSDVIARLNGEPALSAAPHVPVPLPSENRTKRKERPVSKKKLPPI